MVSIVIATKLAEDELGVYAIRPVRTSLLRTISEDRARILVDEMIGAVSWKICCDEGNRMFHWLWRGIRIGETVETGIGDLIDEGFEIYVWHQAQRNNRTNKGWLRTMYHSLTQQIIRQDLEYWLLYACLRPDRNPRLVSYPFTQICGELRSDLFSAHRHERFYVLAKWTRR